MEGGPTSHAIRLVPIIVVGGGVGGGGGGG